MTVRQQIQWVTLPAGVTADGARLRASVFVAPRLSGDEGVLTLESFPDFLDWPARIAETTFVVEGVSLIGAGGPPEFFLPGVRAGEPPDSALWRALFGPRTPVTSFAFDDHSAASMRSFPAREVATSTRAAYTGVAVIAPDRMPTSEDLAGTAMSRFIATPSQTVARGFAAGEEPEVTALQRVVDFYQPPSLAQATFDPDAPAPPVLVPELDFHQMLSLLGDHPALLRRLGLVVDLTFPAGSVVDFGGVAMRVRPAWQSLLGAVNRDLTPLSRYRHLTPESAPDGRRRFTRASPLGELAADAGLKFLPETDFSLEQSDTDGTTLKLVAMDPTVPAALPAVRSGGLALVRDRRDEVLRDDFQRARLREEALAHDQPVELGDDDLVRGHRLDVFDADAGLWRSLHQRVVEYRVPGHPLEPVSDEGFFQISLARPGAVGQPYLHDQVVTWDGWSLSAPRPGKVLPPDARAPDPTVPESELIRPENAIGTAMPLRIEVAARPGSLPRLRFGRDYRVRVRTVDLAGNGPGLDEDLHLAPDALLHYALPGEGSLTYRRFEPVPAPALVPRAPLSDGAAPDRIVIRTFADAREVTPDERHVVLPKAPLELVERHGMLDEAIGDSTSAEARRATYEIARREKGDLATVHPEERLAVPYLPDPLAEGVIFFGLPGLPEGQPFSVDCRGEQWFAPRSFLIRLVDGTSEPEFDAAARVLTVKLPPSGVATVRVASKVTVDENLHGLLDWCRRELPGERFAVVRDAALANRHWMITPWRELTLVHAVQRPLRTPVLEIEDTGREFGATAAKLRGTCAVHPASTERLDVRAEWTETRDDETEDGPRTHAFSTPVLSVPVALARSFEGAPPSEVPARMISGEFLWFNAGIIDPAGPVPHEFGDTKRRVVRYQPILTSEFSGYFPPGTDCSVTGEPVEVSIPNTAPPAAPELLYVIPTVRWQQAEPAPGQMVRRRRGGGLRVYLDRPWFSTGDGETLGIIVLDHAAEPGEVDYPWVTLLGQDAIRFGSAPRVLDAFTFRNADAVLPQAYIAQIGPRGGDTAIVSYAPEYDPVTRRWFCDVELDTGGAYFPFVRLALIRFQEDSVGGAQISRIVVADPVQTLPDRTLIVDQGPQAWRISLTGPAYLGSETTPPPRVSARWERRSARIADEDLGWEPETTVELAPDLPERTPLVGTWSGELPVLAPAPPAPVRLVVIEEEQQAADDPSAGIASRVVYSDTIPA